MCDLVAEYITFYKKACRGLLIASLYAESNALSIPFIMLLWLKAQILSLSCLCDMPILSIKDKKADRKSKYVIFCL